MFTLFESVNETDVFLTNWSCGSSYAVIEIIFVKQRIILL